MYVDVVHFFENLGNRGMRKLGVGTCRVFFLPSIANRMRLALSWGKVEAVRCMCVCGPPFISRFATAYCVCVTGTVVVDRCVPPKLNQSNKEIKDTSNAKLHDVYVVYHY